MIKILIININMLHLQYTNEKYAIYKNCVTQSNIILFFHQKYNNMIHNYFR